MNYNHIIVSRTDAIGDVVLTLPLCGLLKKHFPNARISFLGRTYTAPIIAACTSIDSFINYDDLVILPKSEQVNYLRSLSADVFIHIFPVRHLAGLAKEAGIAQRIGTKNRLFHWTTCTSLVSLSRKNSPLHEAELNLFLLAPLGITSRPAADQLYLYYNLAKTVRLPETVTQLLSNIKFNLILHPKSHGSGMEWSLDNYRSLIAALPEGRYRIFISGSAREKTVLHQWISELPNKDIIDVTGTMTLGELIAFFHLADGLLASGTGPLHLAAATGINTLGLFPPTRPIHAGRWRPLGEKSGHLTALSRDLNTISTADVLAYIKPWQK